MGALTRQGLGRGDDDPRACRSGGGRLLMVPGLRAAGAGRASTWRGGTAWPPRRARRRARPPPRTAGRERHRGRPHRVRPDAGADGRAGAHRHRDVRDGRVGLRLPHRRRARAAPQHAEEPRLRAALQLRPRRHPDVPADGPVRDPRRALRGAVPLRARVHGALEGRHRDGGRRRLRGLRRDLRLVARDRGDDGAGDAAGAEARRLFGQPVDRARWPPAARWAS